MKNILKNKSLLILFVILAIAAFLRLYNLGTNPFVADEFLDVNATYGYFQTGQWQAWDFNHGEVSTRINPESDRRAWLYRTQVTALYNVLPPTETTARLVSALWGIIMTALLYFVTLSFTRNRAIALLAAFFFAVSVPAIEMDRKLRMYAMFAPVFLAFSWAVFGLLERSRRLQRDAMNRVSTVGQVFSLNYWYLLPAVFLGALAFHLHPLTGNIVLVTLVYFVVMAILAWRQKGTEGSSLHASAMRYGVYVGGIILAGIVAKVAVPQVFAQFASGLVFFEDHWSYLGHIGRNYWHPLLGGLMMILGAVYLVRRTDDQRPTLYMKTGQATNDGNGTISHGVLQQKAGVWIVCNFAVILFAAIFLWQRVVGPQYIFFAQSFGLILAAAGVYAVADFFRRYILVEMHGNTSVRPHVFSLAIIVAVVFLPNYVYFFQENNTYHLTSSADTPNYRKVFDYVKRNTPEEGSDVLITRKFRNYYFNDLGLKIFDFGSERDDAALAQEGKVRKVTQAQVEEIVAMHPSGWVVFSDNDEKFIEKEARAYFDEHFEKVTDSPLVRGKISVYRWTP